MEEFIVQTYICQLTIFTELLSDSLLTETIPRKSIDFVIQLHSQKSVPRSSRCLTTVFKVFEKYLCRSSTFSNTGRQYDCNLLKKFPKLFFKDFDQKNSLKNKECLFDSNWFRRIPPNSYSLENYKVWIDQEMFCKAAILQQFFFFISNSL